ncbi:MAG: diphthamide biosynthesis enzyme Dph2 [Methermicoccaceae archaeon]
MRIDDLVLDFTPVLERIKKEKLKKIGICLPEGLKRKAPAICTLFEEIGCDAIVSGKACYGACDVDMELLRHVDLLVHVGHSKMLPLDKVVYVEGTSDIDVTEVIELAIPLFEEKKIGLTTTVQHIHTLPTATEMLRKHGIEACIVKGDARLTYSGQVLGCNFSTARGEFNEVLFIGGGLFHPVLMALATQKRVIVADPYLGEARDISNECDAYLKERYTAIGRAMDAERFGIIVCTKIGQFRPSLAYKLMNVLKEEGKEAIIIWMDEVSEEEMMTLGLDAYVVCGCPRIAIDNYHLFSRPVLTPYELEMVLGRTPLHELHIDEIHGLGEKNTEVQGEFR